MLDIAPVIIMFGLGCANLEFSQDRQRLIIIKFFNKNGGLDAFAIYAAGITLIVAFMDNKYRWPRSWIRSFIWHHV